MGATFRQRTKSALNAQCVLNAPQVNFKRVRLAVALGQYARDGQHRHGEKQDRLYPRKPFMSYITSPLRIYVHCPDDKCGCHRAALAFLHSWGIEPSFGYDGNHYLEFVVPAEWPKVQIRRFTDALNQQITVKDTEE